MEEIRWSGLVFVFVFLSICAVIILFSNSEKKKKPLTSRKAVSPPDEHLLFLLNYKYGNDEAKDMWAKIRSGGGEEELAVEIYTQKFFYETYMTLGERDQRLFTWYNPDVFSYQTVKIDPGYRSVAGELFVFIKSVRAYTG